MSAEDDNYDDYEGFDDYVPKTIDPGPWMLIGVSVYSLICIIILPFLVVLGNSRDRRRMEKMKLEVNDLEQVSTASISDVQPLVQVVDFSRPKNDAEERRVSKPALVASTPKRDTLSGFGSVISMHSSVSMNSRTYRSVQRHGGRRGRSRLIARSDLYQKAIDSESCVPGQQYGIEVNSNGNVHYSAGIDAGSGIGTVDDILPEHAADAHDPGQATPFLEDDDDVETTICFGTRALCSKATISRSFNALVKIANPDKETKRLLALGVPFTLASMIGSFFEAVAVALVSNYLGVNALSAYVVTNLLVGLSDVFINGISDSLNTVCSHAIGAENYKLAGQYVQIAMTVYCVLGIPVMGVWWFIMEDCLRLFGLNEEVVAIGAQYSKIVIFHYMFSGLFDSYTALLDISGYAVPATVFDVITGGAEAVVIWSLLEFQEGMTLYWVGVAHLVTGVSCFIVFTSIAVCKGWLDPFWDGMFKTFAMKNTNAVKYVLKTAIPLSIGSLLEYGEWEALTFFAAFLGPAEVAAWGILEAIWDLFESATEGLSEAGSIRLAFHLGKGNVKQAPISAWKSLFLSSILAVFITAIFFICGDDLPGWFTKDETLQNMLTSMIPLVGMGNILMIFGMVSWSLVGAQGRYKLATTVSAIMSFCVTIPLAAVFCIAYQFTLDGLVAAIVIGYSTTGLVLAYILLRSDWKHISKTIQEYHEEEGSMSSSSSSSSSSSDDSEEGNRLKKDVLGQIDDDKTFSNDELVNSSSESLEHEIQIMPIGNV